MKRLMPLLAIAVCVACLALGCGREPFPKKPLKPVRGFSLGGVRAPEFKQRPSARELYDATLRLHDSFKSAAMSAESISGFLRERALQGPTPLELKNPGSMMTTEARAIEPARSLEVFRSERTLAVEWTSGNKHYELFNTRRGRRYSDSRAEESHSAAASWIGLVPGTMYRMAEPRLLSDQVIAGTPTYVLELRADPKKTGSDWRGMVKRLYLGKNDLLLRRSETVRDGDEIGSVTVVRGFLANPKLSPSIFPTRPPKDARKG